MERYKHLIMINPDLKLNPKLFDEAVEQARRDGEKVREVHGVSFSAQTQATGDHAAQDVPRATPQ